MEISLFAMWKYKNTAIHKLGREPSLDSGSADNLILDFPASRIVRDKHFLRSPVWDNLLQQPNLIMVDFYWGNVNTWGILNTWDACLWGATEFDKTCFGFT